MDDLFVLDLFCYAFRVNACLVKSVFARDILKPLNYLTYFDISHNSLSFLPFDMFSTNTNLKVLNLGFNQFQTISFRLDILQKLTIIDIQSNKIQNIEGYKLSRLRSFVEMQLNSTGQCNFQFILQGNPLDCTCESSKFIKWLASISSLKDSVNDYACIYKGNEIQVDTDAVEKSKYLCIRTVVNNVCHCQGSGPPPHPRVPRLALPVQVDRRGPGSRLGGVEAVLPRFAGARGEAASSGTLLAATRARPRPSSRRGGRSGPRSDPGGNPSSRVCARP